MFDILASTYMTASRMDHWLEQDFMHRDPSTAARLRHIHGLTDPSIGGAFRGRIGMDGPIERARKPSQIAARARQLTAFTGRSLRLTGEWLEQTAEASCRSRSTARQT